MADKKQPPFIVFIISWAATLVFAFFGFVMNFGSGQEVLRDLCCGFGIVDFIWFFVSTCMWLKNQEESKNILVSFLLGLSLLFPFIFCMGIYIYKSNNPKLTSMDNLQLVISETFERETIDIDGKDFVNCVFKDCTLVWKGDSYQFSEKHHL